MNNVQAALDLAWAGLYIFPCSSNKQPKVGKWSEQSTNDIDIVSTWWRQNPASLPAIDCGKSGLLVIDPDRHVDDVDGIEAFELLEAANEPLPDHPCVKTPNGFHHIFRQPDSNTLGNREGKLRGKGINIRGSGGYIIAVGTTIAAGSPLSSGGRAETDLLYTLAEGSPDLIESYKAGTIPELPAWFVELLTNNESPLVEQPPIDRLHHYAVASLEGAANDVAGTFKGSRNNILNEKVHYIAGMVEWGKLSESEIYSAFKDACHRNRMIQDDGLKAFNDTYKSGYNSGRLKPLDPPHFFDEVPAQMDHDPDTGEVVEAFKSIEPLTRDVPGLVGEIIEWVVSTARVPNRILALGTALTTIGTLIGRRVGGPTDSGTHLYVLMLGRTGSGKDHPLKSAGRLLDAAKANHLLGASEFTTDSAVNNTMVDQPCSLCPMDEFGSFLKRITAKRASGWEKNVTKVLRTAWGSSFDLITTPAYAGRKSSTIRWPALSILGASTHAEFYEALGDGDLSNGTLNRFLVLSISGDVKREKNPKSARNVPPELAARLQALWTPDDPSKLARPPVTVPWESVAAKLIYENYEDYVDSRINADQSLECFIARSAEMAVRLATIRAIGRAGDAAEINVDDIQWAVELADICGRLLAHEAHDKMVKDEIGHTKSYDKIYQLIKSKREISHSDVLRFLARTMKKAAIADHIDGMIESGKVKIEKRPGKKGPPAKWYRAA